MEHFYIGTNSIRGSMGIYCMELNQENGSVQIQSTVQAYNTGRLCWPGGAVLYALSEGMTFMGQASGGIITLSLEDSPVITSQTVTDGQRPCAVSISADKSEISVGHFLGGQITVFKLDAQGRVSGRRAVIHTGALEDAPSGIHDIAYSPDGSHLLALEVREHAIQIYCRDNDFQRTGTVYMGEGVFPRQMVFSCDGRMLYVVSQKKSQIYVYRWKPEYREPLQLMQTVSTLPCNYLGPNAPSAIRISPDGTLLAVANRIFDHMTLYRIEMSGQLGETAFCRLKGSLPRDFGFSSDGKYLIAAETASDSVSCYRVHARELGLEWTDTCHVPSPAAVAAGKSFD